MKRQPTLRPTTSHGNGGQPIAPYPLGLTTMGLWLRRGERLGQVMRGLQAAVFGLAARAWRMFALVTTKPPVTPPSEPSQ